MQAVALKSFKIPARNIAKLSWGDINATYRCNRRGAYYYSCSGHGGYVVDSHCLTKRERAKIDKYIQPLPLRILVQQQDGKGDMVIGVSCAYFQRYGPFRRKSYRYSLQYSTPEWQEMPVYLFEEDCDWAVLEKMTDIRADGSLMTEKQRQKSINRTFNRWYRNKTTE